MSSPTQRTLDRCRKLGWRAHVVEKWIAQIKRRVDVFGFGDVLALDGGAGSLLIQATSGDHTANRVYKIIEECTGAALDWLAAGNRIQVWGWRKLKRGPKSVRWSARRVAVRSKDGALFSVLLPEERETDG